METRDRQNAKALLTAIDQRRLPDIVADKILDAARAGSINEGERLPSEPELARQLGVGRTTVREALGKLQALGLVEVVRGRGAFVRTSGDHDNAKAIFARWSQEHRFEITHLVEVRISLESVAAGLAAGRATKSELSTIQRLNDDHQAASDADDDDLIVTTDAAFHGALIQASDNPFLVRLYAALADELIDFRRKTLALPGAPSRSVRGHQAIVDALRVGDAAAARSAAVDHLWVLYREIDEAAKSTKRNSKRGSLAPKSAFDTPPTSGRART